MFYIFFEVPTWSEELKARHEVLIEIMKLGKELGVNFAFPTQTLHMENFPGKESLSPSYESPDALNNKLNLFFEKK
jgi:MscS family membrane protein